MEYGIAFVAGAIHKLYDDVQDTNVQLPPLYLEALKVLMVATMTLMFVKSPGVSLFFLIIIAIYGSLGRIDSDVWKACVPIPFLTCLVNYDQYSFLNMTDTVQRLFALVVISFIMYFEDGLIPEETSVRKSIIRIGFIGIAGTFLYLYRNLSALSFVGPILWFLIGYLLANLAFHWKTLVSPQTKTEPSRPSVLPTKTKNTETQAKQDEVLEILQQDDVHSLVSDSNSVLLKSSEVQ
jgi:hypothetical protein